jgi:exonuclease III
LWSSPNEPEILNQEDHNNDVTLYGDQFIVNATDIIRTVSLNVNGLPKPGTSTDKYPMIFQYMAKLQIQVLCLQETNTRFDKCPPNHRLQELTSDWFRSVKTNSTWNRRIKTDERFQYGGTAIILRDEASDRFWKSGADPSGLGRWCWMLLRGYAGKSLLILSGYRPCLNAYGPESVWNQHKTYFDSLTPPRNIDPREAFTMDLIENMKKIHSKGSQLVLCMDTNFQKLKLEGNSFEIKLKEIGIKDIILTNHDRQAAPPTSATGSKPIDTISTGLGLIASKCGYLPIPSFTNHKSLFCDIKKWTRLARNPYNAL